MEYNFSKKKRLFWWFWLCILFPHLKHALVKWITSVGMDLKRLFLRTIVGNSTAEESQYHWIFVKTKMYFSASILLVSPWFHFIEFTLLKNDTISDSLKLLSISASPIFFIFLCPVAALKTWASEYSSCPVSEFGVHLPDSVILSTVGSSGWYWDYSACDLNSKAKRIM